MKIGLTIFFFITVKLYSLPKDSIIVYEKGGGKWSNSYIFYCDGVFKHFFATDDGQVWYGKGIYKDSKFRRTLIFKEADSTSELESMFRVHYEVNFERKLRIKGRKFKSRDYYGTTRKRFVWLEKIRICEMR